MSHFSVLVIGDNVNEQLAPYHEFESTGKNNQYVQDIDVTEEYRKDYNKYTQSRFISPSGENFSAHENQFYREFTDEELEALKAENGGKMPYGNSEFRGQSYTFSDWDDDKGYRPKIHFLPEGYTNVMMKMNEFQSFRDFIESWGGYKVVPFGELPDIEEVHKFGYILVDENGNVIKVVKRTNPNEKWDWYNVGGRWTGFFKLKKGREGLLGRRALMGDAPKMGWVDVALKGAIDFDGMRDHAGTEAGIRYDKVFNVIGHLPAMESWDSIRNRHEKVDEAREIYHAQERVVALRSAEDKDMIWYDAENFNCSREEYVNKARASAIVTFAIVKDGKWYQRGEMGWWGIVSNEEDPDIWNQKYNELLDSISDDTMLTLVDCHI